uniref:Putative secreted protein n=1 Tax=Ixodes ricinus TaxID=34613 RepID=A0A6B0UVD1_IXORI
MRFKTGFVTWSIYGPSCCAIEVALCPLCQRICSCRCAWSRFQQRTNCVEVRVFEEYSNIAYFCATYELDIFIVLSNKHAGRVCPRTQMQEKFAKKCKFVDLGFSVCCEPRGRETDFLNRHRHIKVLSRCLQYNVNKRFVPPALRLVKSVLF